MPGNSNESMLVKTENFIPIEDNDDDYQNYASGESWF